MALILPSVKGSALLCAEYEANILWSMDLANSTGELNCSKISPSSLTTCLSTNSVITTIKTNITANATAIGEVAQDLTDAQTALQSNINALTTLVNNQNTTISDLNTQISSLVSAFNSLDGTVASFNSRLLSVEGRMTTLEAAIASGIIVVWSGAIVDIPAQYFLCNGSNSTPDLRNRFVIAAGGIYAVNAIGGTASHSHTINGSTEDTSLTVNQLPAHNHLINDPGHRHTFFPVDTIVTNDGMDAIVRRSDYGSAPIDTTSTSVTGITILNTGSNGGHDHGVNLPTTEVGHIPSYYALAYIMKV